MKKVLYIFMFLLVCSSCTKEKLLSNVSRGNTSESKKVEYPVLAGSLRINEFVAAKSKQENEYGRFSDWVELYNPTNHEIHLKEGQWFFTDDIIHNRKKFEIPEVRIPSQSHIVIWCDGRGFEDYDIHSNFKLSGEGENIGIYYENGDQQIVIDSINYTEQKNPGNSFGRVEDGSSEWVSFNEPSIGKSNHKDEQ